MTPKEFAAMLRVALYWHEKSWNGEKYVLTTRQAVEHSGCPQEWVTIITCLMTKGYADVWEWCDEVEAG